MSIKRALLQRDNMDSKDFSHGYLLTGNQDISRKKAYEMAETLLSPQGCLETHPDFSYQTFDLFSIKNSQELRDRASKRPFSGDKKVFIIELNSFSIESANALLKIFEEPYEGTYFFVIISSADEVLPTLRSRLTVINSGMDQNIFNEDKIKFYKKFLKDLPNKRLDSIKNIVKDREEAINFLNELEIFLAKEPEIKILEEIQKCRDFLYQKGSSPKMILEHLALSLP